MNSLSGPRSSALAYRPYWQLVVLGVLIVAAGFVGSQVSGQPWRPPGFSIVLVALVIVACCIAFRALHLSPAISPLLQEPAALPPSFSPRGRLLWPLVGFLGVTSALLLLEKAHPFYFSQDDNLHANLPVMLQGCQNFFAGIFPRWNPYQYMGSPTTSLGYYEFTYPLLYAAYWFAKHVLGNQNVMVDVLAFFHLLLGYLAFYWVARRAGCRPAIAMLAASCYSLSGYALIFSRSFIQFSSIMLWAPLLIACLQELIKGQINWKWILAFGACIGIHFHAGHIQMWAYSILLADFAILLLLLLGVIRFRALVACLAAHLVGLAIAAPLLVPELLAARNSERFRDDTGIWTGLKGLFVPDTLSHAPHPINWGVGYPIGEMYYSGTLFLLLASVLLVSFLSLRWSKSTANKNIWFLCALFAFLLALGDRGILWTVLSHLPGFDHFRFPFKFLGLFDLFVILAGAIALERLLSFAPLTRKFEIPIVILVCGLLAYHCSLATAAFYVYPFAPFPTPDPNVTRFLLPEGERYYPKVLPVETLPDGKLSVLDGSGNRSTDPAFLDSYMNQWPTLRGVFSLSGDDPLVRESSAVQRFGQTLVENIQLSMAEYGVNYLLQYTPPGVSAEEVLLQWPGVRLVYASKNVRLYEMPFVRPMAFPENDPTHALRVKFDVTGARIETSEINDRATIILNMLWREEFRAIADVKDLPVASDSFGRIRINVPAGVRSVRVAFCPPWKKGFLAAGILFLCGLSLGWWSIRRQKIAV